MVIEREKTYLLKYIPQNLLGSPFEEYLDIYIPDNVVHPHIRIRKMGENFEITKKVPILSKDRSKQSEFTINIDKNEYLYFESNIKGKRAKKTRYFYKYKGNTAEIDVFQDDLKGLILADFEFENEKLMNLFKIPEFCLIEVTQEDFLAGGMLAGKTYSNINNDLLKLNYKPLYIN